MDNGRSHGLEDRPGVTERAARYQCQADAASSHGDFDAALEYVARALRLFEQAGDWLGQANAHLWLGDLAKRRDDLDGAGGYYATALGLYVQGRSWIGQANTQLSLGELAYGRDDLDGAAVHYETAMDLYVQEESQLGQANAHQCLGDRAYRRGDQASATGHFDIALRLHSNLQSRLGQAGTHRSLGDLARDRGDLDGAAGHYAAALEVYGLEPSGFGRANVHFSLGYLAQRRGDWEGAAGHLRMALELYGLEQSSLGQANTLQAMGDLAHSRGDLAGASAHYAAALDLYEGLQSSLGQARNHLAQGELASRRLYEHLQLSLGQESKHSPQGALSSRSVHLDDAAGHLAAALRLFTDLHHRAGLGNVHKLLGDVSRYLGDFDAAAGHYATALELFEQLQDRLGQAGIHRSLGVLARLRGDPNGAVRHYGYAVDLYELVGALGSVVEVGGLLVEVLVGSRTSEEGLAAGLGVLVRVLVVARRLGRWVASPVDRARILSEVAGVHARALELAHELGAAGRAGEVIELVTSALVTLLPALLSPAPVATGSGLDGSESADTAIDGGVAAVGEVGGVVAWVRELVAELVQIESAFNGMGWDGGARSTSADGADNDLTALGGASASEQGVAAREAQRGRVLGVLEQLLGREVRAVLDPPLLDYPVALAQVGGGGSLVVQYSCPRGVGVGAPVFVVWTPPGGQPRVHRGELSKAAAAVVAAFTVLSTEPVEELVGHEDLEPGRDQGLGAGAGAGVGVEGALELGVPAEVGVDLGGVGLLTRWAGAARYRFDLLDAGVDTVGLGDLAGVLFPSGLVDWLTTATVTTAASGGVPPWVLLVPDGYLWNLPWGGLPVPDTGVERGGGVGGPGRVLLDVAVPSLSTSLTSLRTAAESDSDTDAGVVSGAGPVVGWFAGVGGAQVERNALVGAFGGRVVVPGSPQGFLEALGAGSAVLGVVSVHGQETIGLGHGLDLTAGVFLSAAHLLVLRLPPVLVIGACWAARLDPDPAHDPVGLTTLALARGARHVIAGVYPLPDEPIPGRGMTSTPTAGLLAALYRNLATDPPAVALWKAQQAHRAAGMATHTWAGLLHITTEP